MWRVSFSVSRLAPFWLAFCFALFQVPLTAQATNSGPGPQGLSQNALSSLSSLSDELVERLKLRVEQSNASEQNFRKIIADWEERWMTSVLDLDSLQTEHAATLSLLSESQKALEAYKESSAKRARLDAEAIAQARGAVFWWAAGSASAGVVIGWLLHW